MRSIGPIRQTILPVGAFLFLSVSGPDAAQQDAKVTRRVEALSSPNCHLLAEPDDLTNDATIWVGLVTDITRRPLREQSADLARHELATVGKGLPPVHPGASRRPLAFVSCDSAKPTDATFQHLIGRLKLPLVIGPEYSGQVLDVLTKYTVPARSVLLTVASATALSAVAPRGLFFRTSVHDGFQTKVQSLVITQVIEPELRASGTLAARQQMKIFVAYKGDAYGRALADSLANTLRFNGKSARENGTNFRRTDYGNRDDPTSNDLVAKYASAAHEIVMMQPHLAVVVGTTEAEQIIAAVERDWPAELPFRPRWLVTEGVQSVLPRIHSPDGSFAQRVLATIPKIDFESPEARRWLSTLATMHPDTFQNDPRSPNALALYDLVYATAFATTHVGSRPLNGDNIGAALRDLNRAGVSEVQIGPEWIGAIFEKLETGQPVNIRGGSGALDWDENGDVLQDIDILCLAGSDTAGTHSVALRPSGLYFDVRLNRFAGEIRGCGGSTR